MSYKRKFFLLDERGLSVVEILVVIFIITVALVSLLRLTSFSIQTSTLMRQNTQAVVLAKETMEAIRNFKDGIAWNNDDPGNEYDGLGVLGMSDYYPRKSTDSPPRWQMIVGEEIIGGFTRKIRFHGVNRDINGDIVEVGGVNDPDTKKATVFVSWEERGRLHQIAIATYFTNWK